MLRDETSNIFSGISWIACVCVHTHMVLHCGNPRRQCDIVEKTLDLESRHLNFNPRFSTNYTKNCLPSPIPGYFISQCRCGTNWFPKSLPVVKYKFWVVHIGHILIQLKHIILICLAWTTPIWCVIGKLHMIDFNNLTKSKTLLTGWE